MDEREQKKRGLLGSLLELFGEDEDEQPPAKPSPPPAEPAPAAAAEAHQTADLGGLTDDDPEPQRGRDDPAPSAHSPQSSAPDFAAAFRPPTAAAPHPSRPATLIAESEEPFAFEEDVRRYEPAQSDVQPLPAPDPPVPPARLEDVDPRLAAPMVEDRRAALLEVIRTGVDRRTAPVVGRLLLDPEVEIRLLAVEALKSAPETVPADALARALQDPTDDVRAAAARLAVARPGRAPLELLRLAGTRRWPLAQQTALDTLPRLVEHNGIDDAGLTDLIASIGRLDTPPTPAEERAFAALASVIGLGRLVAELGGQDDTALGAAWLLLSDSSAEALGWLAQQRRPALRVVASMAEQRLAQPAARPTPAAEDVPPAGATTYTEPAREPATAPQDAAPRSEEALPDRGSAVTFDAPTGEMPSRPAPPAVDAPVAGPSAVAGMVRALSDPDDAVRSRAREALRAVDRATVRSWVERALRDGTDEDAALASRACEAVRLEGMAESLLRRASVASPHHREAFVDAIASLQPDAEPVAAMVRATDASKREDALRILWQAYGIRGLRSVKSFLSDSSGPVRLAALELIGQSGEPSVAQTALQVLSGDSSPAVRAAAIKLLARAGTDDRAQAMRQILAEPDPDVRATGMEVLLPRSGAGAQSLVLQALEDPDERVWTVVLHHVASLASEDDGLLWTVLKRCTDLQRAHVLGLVAERDSKTLAWLALRHLDSNEPVDRVLAAELAGQAGTGECVHRLIGALRDPVGDVRRIAARAVSSLRYPEAVPALVAALHDPEPEVRIEVVRALGVIDDEEVVPGLISALNDPDVDVQAEVHSILLRWSSRSVAVRLVEALGVPDLQAAAAELLARMPTAARAPLLETLVQRPDELGEAIGAILTEIAGPESFVPHLTSLDVEERIQALEALGAMGGEDAVTGLIRVLSDPDPQVRIRALQHLGRLGDTRAFDAVRRSFLRDPVHEVVKAADEAVARLQQNTT